MKCLHLSAWKFLVRIYYRLKNSKNLLFMLPDLWSCMKKKTCRGLTDIDVKKVPQSSKVSMVMLLRANDNKGISHAHIFSIWNSQKYNHFTTDTVTEQTFLSFDKNHVVWSNILRGKFSKKKKTPLNENTIKQLTFSYGQCFVPRTRPAIISMAHRWLLSWWLWLVSHTRRSKWGLNTSKKLSP